MAAPILPNPDALAALAAPPAAPPVIPPAPALSAPAAVGGVAQAAQAAPVQQEEVCSWLAGFSPILHAFLVSPFFPSRYFFFYFPSSVSFCTTCSFRLLSLAIVCRLLASRFLFILS